jgi:hypothetical protein
MRLKVMALPGWLNLMIAPSRSMALPVKSMRAASGVTAASTDAGRSGTKLVTAIGAVASSVPAIIMPAGTARFLRTGALGATA